MKIIYLKITDVRPYPENAKDHPKKQVQQIADSIREFGFNQPIVIDPAGVIIVGHGRYQAAKLLELSEVPTLTVDIPEEKAKAYRLADNKLNESKWDMNLVIEELKLMTPEMIDLTGFSRDLILDTGDNDDKMPVDVPTVAQAGDTWALGRHRLVVGDATDPHAVGSLMADREADLVFTDPPYNVDYTGKTKDALKIQNDKKADGAFREFLLKAFTNMAMASKKGAAIYVCHADSEGLNFRSAFAEAGWLLKQCIIWNKNSMVLGRSDYHWKHEPILYGWRAGASHKFYGAHNQTTVWDMQRPSRSAEHPTMKPVELILKALTNSSKEGDIVLDVFGGSGSSLIACEKSGRICYTMELDPKYADVIIKRWEDFTKQKATKI